MKRNILFFGIVFALVVGITKAQNKLLTIQEAVLKGRGALAPKRLQNLGYVPDSKKVAYIDNTQINVLSADNGKVVQTISTTEVNKVLAAAALDTITVFESLKWKTENEFYFTNKKIEWL